MALKSGNTIAAADINALKTRIDNECKRRNGKGSVATLPDNSTYKYVTTTAPLKDRKAIVEHYKKLVDQISYIKTLSDTNLPNYKRIDYNALNKVSSEITTLEGFTKGSANDFDGKTGCKSSCTGLCYSGCVGTCRTACTGNCSDSCTDTCLGDCDGCRGCGSGCASACSGGCKDGCQGCGSGCADTCSGACGGACSPGCSMVCKPGCAQNCGGNLCNLSCTSASG